MLRTPAPFIGALGLSLKRVIALLPERASGFCCNGCSLFSRMLEGRRRAVITPCVFALLSGLTRALLVPASMAALRFCLFWSACSSALSKPRPALVHILECPGVWRAVIKARAIAKLKSPTRALPVPRPTVVPPLRRLTLQLEPCLSHREALQN